ncbi:MAG: response regulator [bacterium]|nr:response regulator [bacterium]
MGKRILVIDDDLYMRELYEEVLKGAGYEVETAVDGKDGIDRLNRGGFNLVFLDMMMPKIDGMGVLNTLVQNPPVVKNGPIILLSNLGHEHVIEEAMQKGAVSNLIKADITPEQLLKAVEKYLGK